MMKKNRIIKPDNTGPREKKVQYILLILFLVLTYFVVNYVVTEKKEKKYLLSTESKETVCKVVGHWHTRLSGNVFEYSVSGKTYKKHNQNNIRFRKGEFYVGRYAKSNPEIIQIDLTSPVIFSQESWKEVLGRVQKTNINSSPNSVSFSYQVLGKEYERTVYVDDAKTYMVGKSCLILVEKENPLISYLKNQVNLKKYH